MSDCWNTQVQRQTASATLSLLTHPATGPLQRIHCEPEHSISLFLSPLAIHARGYYGARPQSAAFQDLGSLVVVPADIPMHVSVPQAPPRTLFCCRFERGRFRELTDFEAHWERAALRACCDVRDSTLERLLRRLAEEIRAPGFASETLADGLSLVCVAELARYLHHSRERTHRSRGGLAPWQLRRVQERIEDVSAAPPTIEALATLCSIGGRHLMRAFKESTGRTVTEFVATVRVRRAKTLLLATALPVHEIARQLHFAHASAFTTAFRKATGDTPRTFRQRGGRAPAH